MAFGINLWRFEMNKISKILVFILFIITALVADTKNVQGFFSKGITKPADEANHNLNKDKKVISTIEYPVGGLIYWKKF